MIGSEKKVFENELGIQMDLSWFSIVSSIFSIAGILLGALWVTDPLQNITNGTIAKLTFVPLLFYRLLAWLVIITFLHSFSLYALAGLVILNIFVLFILKKNKLKVELLVLSILSIVIPIARYIKQLLFNCNESKFVDQDPFFGDSIKKLCLLEQSYCNHDSIFVRFYIIST